MSSCNKTCECCKELEEQNKAMALVAAKLKAISAKQARGD